MKEISQSYAQVLLSIIYFSPIRSSNMMSVFLDGIKILS